ncbi:MAG: ATP-binding protein [Pseudomonadota bacterium]
MGTPSGLSIEQADNCGRERGRGPASADKEMEEALRKALAQNTQLIASITSILVTLDGDNHITQWNRTAERVLGIEASGVVGRSFEECGIEWDLAQFTRGMAECRSTGMQQRLDDVWFKHGEKEGFLGITINPFSGDSPGVLILGADITKRKLLEGQLLQSQKLESIGQLAAGVAHEINNPVGFISSNLGTLDEYRQDLVEILQSYIGIEEMVRKKPESAGDEELAGAFKRLQDLKDRADLNFILADFAKIIQESKDGTDRVRKIVQDLKDFSHVDQAELKRANLNKGLDSTLNIAWSEIKYKAEVIKDYGEIPGVHCYPQQINQVFMNILVNAAQAIEEKGEIRISTRYLNDGNPRVEIRISDTGKGIPPENLRKIFDPFFTSKPVGKGTGLGLSMAYNIVKKHRGELKVESEVGKGATFTIELPVRGPEEG